MSHKTGIFFKKSIRNFPVFWPILVVSIFQTLICKFNENNLRFFFACFEFVKSVIPKFRNFKIRKIGKWKIGKSEDLKLEKSENRKIRDIDIRKLGDLENRKVGKSESWKIGKSENWKIRKSEIRTIGQS